MVKEMPVPPTQLMTLASRLDAFSIAIAALHRLLPDAHLPKAPTPAGTTVRVEEKAFVALSEEYLAVRENFEATRAQYEHDFMAWHGDIVTRTDALYRGEPIPGTPAQVMPVSGAPEWVDPATPDSE